MKRAASESALPSHPPQRPRSPGGARETEGAWSREGLASVSTVLPPSVMMPSAAFPGTFDRTMQAIAWAQELEMPLQVNTLAAAETADDVPAIYELLKPYGIARWSLFFLISVGRGKVLQPLSAEDGEKLMSWIYDTSRIAPFTVATTEAPSYRRVALERMRAEGMPGDQIKRNPAARGFGIRDGHGIMFVSNTGEICPAGFLPLAAGNVRKDRVDRHLPQLAAVPKAPRSGATRRKLRRLRVSFFMWRLSRASV